MTINHQFGDVDAHGVPIRARAMALHAGHQATLRNEPAMEDFSGGAGSSARLGFITGSHPAALRRFQRGLRRLHGRIQLGLTYPTTSTAKEVHHRNNCGLTAHTTPGGAHTKPNQE